MLDAYTVRKAVPRILIAVIGINLSIYICVLAVDVTMVLGRGIDTLLTTPFVGTDGIDVDGTAFSGNLVLNAGLPAALVGIILSSFLLTGGGTILGALMSIILAVALVALAVLFTLIVRQALVIFLTVVSPVAIACFVLPGTEKYFKKWLDLFIKTLMVYPIIAIMFAMSTVMGAILLNDATGSSAVPQITNTASIDAVGYFAQSTGQPSDGNQAFKILAAIVVIYAPLALIPFAFKMAGGAIGAIFNAAQGVTAGKRELMRKQRFENGQRAKAKNWDAIKGGERFKSGSWLARRTNTALQTGSIIGSGKIRRSRIQAERTVRDSTAFGKAMENDYVKNIISNDDLLDAYANDGMAGARRYFTQTLGMTGRELNQNLGMVKLAENAVGAQTLSEVAVVANAGTGSGYAGGNYQMLEAIERVTRNDPAKRGRLVAMARSNAERANRGDLAAPFAASMQALEGISTGRMDNRSGTQMLDRQALITKGGNLMMNLRGQGADRIIGNVDGTQSGELARMVAESEAEYIAALRDPAQDQERIGQAKRAFAQSYAVLANMYDNSSYAPPENAQRLSAILSGNSALTENGESISKLKMLENLRQDADFRVLRREMNMQDDDVTRGLRTPPAPTSTGGTGGHP